MVSLRDRLNAAQETENRMNAIHSVLEIDSGDSLQQYFETTILAWDTRASHWLTPFWADLLTLFIWISLWRMLLRQIKWLRLEQPSTSSMIDLEMTFSPMYLIPPTILRHTSFQPSNLTPNVWRIPYTQHKENQNASTMTYHCDPCQWQML